MALRNAGEQEEKNEQNQTFKVMYTDANSHVTGENSDSSLMTL